MRRRHRLAVAKYLRVSFAAEAASLARAIKWLTGVLVVATIPLLAITVSEYWGHSASSVLWGLLGLAAIALVSWVLLR